MALWGTMRHKKAKRKKPAFASMKVDVEFRDRLSKVVSDKGMTTVGAFRRFGDQIIQIVSQEQDAIAAASAT